MPPTACRTTLGAVAHKTVNVDLRSIGGSALTDEAISVPTDADGHAVGQAAAKDAIPVTYVPARNTIMLSVALGWAEVLGAADIFCGVNAVDYSGYPGLPAGVHRRVREPGQPGHQGRRRGRGPARARAAAVHEQGRHRARGRAPGRGFRRHRVVLPGRRHRAAPAAIATPAACARRASPQPAWPTRPVTSDGRRRLDAGGELSASGACRVHIVFARMHAPAQCRAALKFPQCTSGAAESTWAVSSVGRASDF